MTKWLSVLVLLMAAGCAQCPEECTPEAISACSDRPAIFKNDVLNELAGLKPQIQSYEQHRGFLDTSFDSIVNDAVAKRQDEWNDKHAQIYASINAPELQLVCKFATEDTFGHGELTDLYSILKDVTSKEKLMRKDIAVKAASEASGKILQFAP